MMLRSGKARHLLQAALAIFILLSLPTVGARLARAQATEDAERYTMVLRGVPLEEALEKLVTTTQINLVYDADLVGGARIFCAAKEASPQTLLRCILRDAALDFYRTSSGTYVLASSPRQPPQYGRLAGIVVDEGTGEPLPHASVLLADAGTGTAANDAGLFNFSSLVPGLHRVVITHIGYEPAIDSVWVPAGESVRRRIALHAKPVATGPIVIDGLQRRLPSSDLEQSTLSADELAASSGLGTADVMRSASSLLGVVMKAPTAELHIQGGAAGEHQMRLDGTPVRNPVVLGQLLGAFSPLAIKRLTVHKAGFGAPVGSRISGVLTAEHILGDPAHRYGLVRVDPLSINGRVHQHFEVRGVRSGAMAAVRQSLWGMYRDPTLDHLLQQWRAVDPLLLERATTQEVNPASLAVRQQDADVRFSDVHAAARLHLSPFHVLQASLYQGRSVINARSIASENPGASLLARDRYHWTNWVGQLRYDWMVSARMMGALRLHGSWQSLGHGYEIRASRAPLDETDASERPRPYDGNRVSEMGMEAEATYDLGPRHHLRGALEVTRLASKALVGDGLFRPLLYDVASWQLSGYVEEELSLGVQTIVEAGTRFTYLPTRRTVYAEPRLAVRYDGATDRMGSYALRLGGGLYRQFVGQFDLSSPGPTALAPTLRFWLPVDRSLVPPRAYHLTANALWEPAAAWQVDLEAYYKWLPHLLEIDYRALVGVGSLEPYSTTLSSGSQEAFLAPSRGQASGVGVRLERTSGRVRGALRYSLSQARRIFPARFEGRMVPVPWNQPHRLSLEGSVVLTPVLTARLGAQGVWGRSWAFRKAYYDHLALQEGPDAFAPFDLSAPSEHTLAPLYQLDAGLTYARTWKGISVEVSADLLNVMDRQNAFDWGLRRAEDGYEKTVRTLPGRRFVLSVSVGY